MGLYQNEMVISHQAYLISLVSATCTYAVQFREIALPTCPVTKVQLVFVQLFPFQDESKTLSSYLIHSLVLALGVNQEVGKASQFQFLTLAFASQFTDLILAEASQFMLLIVIF